MAAPLLLRGIPLLRLRLHHRSLVVGLFASAGRPSFCTATEPSQPHDNVTAGTGITTVWSPKDPLSSARSDCPDYRRWKDKESEILQDIEPTIFLTKEILHSDKYMDGQSLTDEDEKAVVEKLLVYHPHSEDKIGCGLDYIMVDRHPQFQHSRCLFVMRTDGGWIDFSYQKCLRAYIRDKYPSHAERFIREHFKRGSG